jgi:hypothetical protein
MDDTKSADSSALRKNLMRAVLLDALTADLEDGDGDGDSPALYSPSTSSSSLFRSTQMEECLHPEELGMHLQDLTLEPRDNVRTYMHDNLDVVVVVYLTLYNLIERDQRGNYR